MLSPMPTPRPLSGEPAFMLTVLPTDAAPAGLLADAHSLVREAFATARQQDGPSGVERFTKTDWAHALGGLHVFAWAGDRLVGHAAVVPRPLEHRGRRWDAGYVEALGVAADSRRLGVGSAVVAALDPLIRGRYELGALSSTQEAAGRYAAAGWLRWRGTTSVRLGGAVIPTPEDDGSVHVLPVGSALDLDGPLTCQWRPGDVW